MKERKTLYLETTTVPVQKTVGEISALLVRAGAREIMQTFDSGQPAGVKWSMDLYGRTVWFQMPVRVDSVYQVIAKRYKGILSAQRRAALKEQAARVAWRQLLAWTQVQIAMVQLNMAEFAQVFLPYVLDTSQRTMWDLVKDSQFKQLEGPKQ